MLFIQDGKQKRTPSSKNLGTLPYQLHKTEKKNIQSGRTYTFFKLRRQKLKLRHKVAS